MAERTIERADLARRTLVSLATRRGDPTVTSLYVDVDGRHRPVAADCITVFERLARAVVRHAGSVGADRLRRAVEADVGSMRSWLTESLDRSGARGVALFACSEQSFLEVVELPRPVRDQATFGPVPHLLQLATALQRDERFLAVLVDRRNLRLLRVELGEATELPASLVEIGGFERRMAELGRAHYRESARRVEHVLAAWPCRRLVVAGPDEALAGLKEQLSPAIRRRIVGRAGIDVSADTRVVRDAVLAVAATARRRHEADVVEELRQLAASGRGGVVGLERTLAALALRAVGTLVVADGFATPGAQCPSCGWRGIDLAVCPSCRSMNEEVPDVVAVAVAEALAEGARVEVCRDIQLERLGRIGTIERHWPRAG